MTKAEQYENFLRRKVEIARASKRLGFSRSNAEVDAEFAVCRSVLLRKANEPDSSAGE